MCARKQDSSEEALQEGKQGLHALSTSFGGLSLWSREGFCEPPGDWSLAREKINRLPERQYSEATPPTEAL